MPKTAAAPTQQVAPLLAGDEARYRRRYRTLKELVDELSDESNLLALRVNRLQRALYDHSVETYGRAPAPVALPERASWAPLIGNRQVYPDGTGAPRSPQYTEDEMDVDDEIYEVLDDDEPEIISIRSTPEKRSPSPEPEPERKPRPRKSVPKSAPSAPRRRERGYSDEPDVKPQKAERAEKAESPEPAPESRRKKPAPAPRKSAPRNPRTSRSRRESERKEREREKQRDVDDVLGDELDLAASAPQSPGADDY